jgi:transcriptional regulator with XRE-family HTH domain
MMDDMAAQKIKQDSEIRIGENIRSIRKSKGVGQTELVGRLQLLGVSMTRETLVKIERGIQHVQASQLRGIRDALTTTYDELLK